MPLVDADLDPLRRRLRNLEDLQLATKLQQIGDQLTAQAAALDTLFTWVHELEDRVEIAEARVLAVEDRVTTVEARVDALENNVPPPPPATVTTVQQMGDYLDGCEPDYQMIVVVGGANEFGNIHMAVRDPSGGSPGTVTIGVG